MESVNLIFSNLEKIWRFQQTFLDALRVAVPNNRIGEVFLEYVSAQLKNDQFEAPQRLT